MSEIHDEEILRESFELPGVPIRITVKSNKNPYAEGVFEEDEPDTTQHQHHMTGLDAQKQAWLPEMAAGRAIGKVAPCRRGKAGFAGQAGIGGGPGVERRGQREELVRACAEEALGDDAGKPVEEDKCRDLQ